MRLRFHILVSAIAAAFLVGGFTAQRASAGIFDVLKSVVTGTQSTPAPNSTTSVENSLPDNPITRKLQNELFGDMPLVLNANDAFTTVANAQLPGGVFRPRALRLSAAGMNQPLPPGDYTLPAIAFCNAYSIHRSGQGTAYTLAPMRGQNAAAISALLWRGTMQNRNLRTLQAVSWSIEAGVPYGQMPSDYQQEIDTTIPDYRTNLEGDVFQKMEGQYNHAHGIAHLVGVNLPATMDQFLNGFGALGKNVLELRARRDAFVEKYHQKQFNSQVLFAGQGQQLPPVRPEEGPWTVVSPGRAYTRFKIVGGNLANDNRIEIRVLPPGFAAMLKAARYPVTFASYEVADASNGTPVSVASALGSPDSVPADAIRKPTGELGYAQGGTGSQALSSVPYPAAQTDDDCQADDPDSQARPLCPQRGDVIVYRDASGIIHVGLVLQTQGRQVLLIRSKWGGGGLYDHSPDFSPYYRDAWKIYHKRNSGACSLNPIDACAALKYGGISVFPMHETYYETDRGHEIWANGLPLGRGHMENPAVIAGISGSATRVDHLSAEQLQQFDCRGWVFGGNHKGRIGQKYHWQDQVQKILDDQYDEVPVLK